MSFNTVETAGTFGGRLVKLTHQSTTANCEMSLNVFMPPALTSGEKEKVPVLLFLSGLNCSGDTAAEQAFMNPRAAQKGIAIVYPDTSPRGFDFPGEDDDWTFGSSAGFYVNATATPWSKAYKMYDYITDELPAKLFAHFPELDATRVSITGHSMGGHGALTLFLKNPGKYKSVSAFAPISNPIKVSWGINAFKGYFGEDEWESKGREHDATELLRDFKGDFPALIDVGLADEFYHEQLLIENLEAAAKQSGNDKDLVVNKHEGYEHSFYFVSTFASGHVDHAAKYLFA